jgi:hypothetical protein
MNLCYSGMLEQLSLLLSEHCHLLVAVIAFLCKLVSDCLIISYSPPEATLKLELHRVQNARSFPNELQVRNLTVTSGVIFFTRPGIYNCISFSLMSKKEY